MERVKTLFEKTLQYTMALMLAVMVVMVFANVVLRYGFGSGIASAEEVARLMFVWMVFLGAVLALAQHKHLGLEIVQAHLPIRWRRASAVLSHGLILYVLWLFVAGSWAQFKIGLGTYSTILRFPMALFAAAGLFAAIAMIGQVLLNLWRIVTGSAKAHLPGDPHPEWIEEVDAIPEPLPAEAVASLDASSLDEATPRARGI